jgi:hypothetical protein
VAALASSDAAVMERMAGACKADAEKRNGHHYEIQSEYFHRNPPDFLQRRYVEVSLPVRLLMLYLIQDYHSS